MLCTLSTPTFAVPLSKMHTVYLCSAVVEVPSVHACNVGKGVAGKQKCLNFYEVKAPKGVSLQRSVTLVHL